MVGNLSYVFDRSHRKGGREGERERRREGEKMRWRKEGREGRGEGGVQKGWGKRGK